jgi:hypothetical protein
VKGSWRAETSTSWATSGSGWTITVQVRPRLRVLSPEESRQLKRLYNEAARRHHPDLGGSDELMAQVNRAYARLDFDELERLSAPGPTSGPHPSG